MGISDISNAAKTAFANVPFPHRKDEYWRFADLHAWGVDGLLPFFASSQPPKGEPCDEVRKAAEGISSCNIRLEDGVAALSGIPEGVEVLSMTDAFVRYPQKLERFFTSAAGKLDIFQASRAADGVFVRVKSFAHAVLSVAVVSRMHISAAGVYFLLEEGASLALDKVSLVFGGSLASARFGFDLCANSKLVYSQHKYSEAAALMFEREDFYVGAGAEVVDAMAQEGLAPSRSERNFYIDGEHSQIDSRVFLKTRNAITADLRTRQIHSVPSAKSNLAVKAALYDSSSIAFTGLIDVCTAAQKTEAYQSCRSLLLSKEAKAQASPILEICANDVMCSHGCTVAEPDMEELFYMRQRGLPLETAKSIIVDSFAGTTFEKTREKTREGA